MSFWTAAVVIVMIWGIVQVYTRRQDRELGTTRDMEGNPVTPPSTRVSDEARREIEDLRERIKVLERIVTENNTLSATETRRISQEIDALRDRQDS